MARSKEYERGDVLAKAVQVFWTQGYKATSMKDIVQATGLNTASMYKEFGDKDGMFEESLDYYRDHFLAPRVRLLTENPDIGGIAAFLESIVNGAAAETYRGCLMMNHLAQKHAISARAAGKIGEFCSELEGLLAAAFRNAQAKGEVPTDKDPEALASFIMFCVHGMVLYGRHPYTKGRLPGIQDIIRRALEA